MIDFTGPQRVLEDPEPTVTGRRARHEPDDSAATSRSRRRVGWRKGSDVDEELWPVEEFGGVSDEQFWDDLATDKPLATTARTAQPGTAATRTAHRPGRHRRTAAGHRPHASRAPRPRGGHRTPDRARIRNPVSARTTGPRSSRFSPALSLRRPRRSRRSPTRRRRSRGRSPPSRFVPPISPRSRACRSRTSAEEDPLTSPAYSLRPRGSVDGRAYPSSRRSADLTRGQYEAAAGQETQAFSLSDAQAAGGGYPDGVPPFRQFDRPSHSGNGGRGRSDAGRPDPLRPDGYRSDPLRSDPLRPDSLRPGDGYGSTVPYTPELAPTRTRSSPTASRRSRRIPRPTDTIRKPADQGGPAADPRQANGAWSPGQVGGNGGGSWGSRPAYPPVNGPRGPYDPQGYDRRLTSLPGPGTRFCITRAFA